jgi:hypothetical protein
MLGDDNTVNDQGGDSVAPELTSGRGMEKLGIFILIKGISNVCPSFPVKGEFLDRQMEGVHRKRS